MSSRGRLKSAVAGATTALALCAAAEPAGAQVTLTPVGSGTYAAPYHVAAPPGDASRVFVVESAGTIRLVKDGIPQPAGQPFLSVPGEVFDSGEGGCECGMFSMAFAPDYATSGLFYVFFTRDAAAQHDLVIREFRRSASNPDLADPASGRDVLVIPHPSASNHNGGQLQFGPDGMLYIATGDGGSTPAQAQNETTLLGKILRIDPRGSAPGQYSIPPGNPLTDGPGGNADEIWTFGLRNPYRFSFDRSTGDLLIGDVGNAAVEEIDFRAEGSQAGSNFGWPCFEGTQTGPIACSPVNPVPPVLEYENPPMGAAAVMAGFVIRDPNLPALAGRYVFADTYGAVPDLRTAQLSPSGLATSTSLGVNQASTVSFGQDACGRIYVVSLAGAVSRIDPAGGPGALCKLAPTVTLNRFNQGIAQNVVERGGLTALVGCDEDCTATVRGSIDVTVPAVPGRKAKGKKGKKGRKKRRRQRAPARSFTISLGPVTSRVELDREGFVRLPVTDPDVVRLKEAFAAGGTAAGSLTATASGGGGGSADASTAVLIAKPKASGKAKKKAKKKRKKRRRKRGGR